MSHVGILISLLLAGGAGLVPAPAQQFVISTYAGGPLATIAAANASIGPAAGRGHGRGRKCVFHQLEPRL